MVLGFLHHGTRLDPCVQPLCRTRVTRLRSASAASTSTFASSAWTHRSADRSESASQRQPRATTELTERDVLAVQKSPDEYLAVPHERIRNFSIIAHIDHGKSTLADRLLEVTGSIPVGGRKQYLDRLPVERARGITVKAQSVSLLHTHPADGKTYLLNLIDTPGHADFSFEVSRSLAACEGAILLVDATQGVQAQTIATFYLALEQNLAIVPVANKVDMDAADLPRVAQQMARAFGTAPDELLAVSAKTGLHVEDVLAAVVERVAPPRGDGSDPPAPLRILLLDCAYDPYRGAVSVVQVVDGAVRVGDRVRSLATGQASEVMELGLMTPEALKVTELRAGHVGYVVTGVRDVKAAKIGDTLHHAAVKPEDVAPLPGFRLAKPMVFQGVFPTSADQFDALRAAVERLTLNDASVTTAPETSAALGPGFRCGFLGLLHADVFHQRLHEEFGTDIIATAPTVPYRVTYPGAATWKEISSPSDLDQSLLGTSARAVGAGGAGDGALSRALVEEPLVEATIISSSDHVGKVVELCIDRRGVQLEHTFLDEARVMMRWRLPLGEVAADFSDELKSRTSGYATFDYDDTGWERADIVRLDVLVNGTSVDALASLVHRDKAQRRGREICARLKDVLPRQMYEVAVQAAIGGKVVARETISALRKNVLAKCYGGDISRKKKLLEKQKSGKKRMRRIGNVDIPNEAFAGLLSNATK